VPVGLVSLYLTQRIVEDPPYMATERNKLLRNPLDKLGLGLITVGIGCLQVVLDKGQEDDWFSSSFILSFTVIALITLVWFVINEVRHQNPILDVSLLRQRNFACSTLMMFVLGMVLFGTTVLIPQFLQVQMGYTAEQAGKTLSLGALVLVFMMPIVGQLVSRVDPRWLVAIGFSGSAMALYHMTILNQQIDFRTAALMRIFQTIFMAFIFIPINTLSYVGMPPNKSNQISGITNLARNIGGSIGISMLSTFLIRLSQSHQVYMVAHAGPSDPAFAQRVAGMTQTFIAGGSPPNVASAQAYAAISRLIAGQSATLAYIDIVSVGAVAVACLAPLVFLMKRPRRGAAPAAAH
jgi:DHA2 family multidrug resistance protein